MFYVASRAHHADIGGITPGSMPPHSKTLDEEGAAIVAFKLVRNGHFQVRGALAPSPIWTVQRRALVDMILTLYMHE